MASPIFIRTFRTIIIFSLSCIFFAQTIAPSFGQDLHFSQFYEAPLSLNPALCGAFNGGALAELNYKNQWSGVAGASGFNTMSGMVSFHNLTTNWQNSYFSTAISFNSDRVGAANIGNSSVYLTLATGVYLDEYSALSAGLQAGWNQYSVNPGALQWGSQYVGGNYDPMAASGETGFRATASFADFSAGLNYNYAERPPNSASTENPFRVNGGIAVYHFNQPYVSYFASTNSSDKLSMRFVLHGQVFYRFVESPVSLVPALIYFQQGSANMLDIGLKMRYAFSEKSRLTGFYKNVVMDGGISLRLGDAIIPTVGFQYENYYMGVSYDVNLSKLATATTGNGGFEISLRYVNFDITRGYDQSYHHAF